MVRTIEVVEHETTWAAAFEQEAAALRRVFGDAIAAIHHVGSTSVPALAAKPIVDILAVLRETDTIDRFSPGMESLGYRVRGECLDAEVPGTPGRFYFSKDTAGVRTHQVHACAGDHPQVTDLLVFRDYLRAHPARAAEYGALKRRLAGSYRHDIVGYIRGKDAFIRTLLDEARAWRSQRVSFTTRWARPAEAAQPVISSGAADAIVRARIAERRIVVAEHGSRTVGALQLEYLWGTRPYIALVRVDPEFQRQGVGRALLAFVENVLRGEGHTALFSSSQENEPEPQAWHRHMGFVDCGRIDDINEPGVGELFFRKPL